MKYDDIDVSKYTPMMQQYLEIKKDYTDAIVFFRLGDFYEMFFDDAFLASRELEIALTGRDAGQTEKIPMCGVPFHAYAGYVEKLVNKGYKVAIVEQIENPSEVKGIVKRDVVKIITPGTIIEAGLNDKENNYLVSIGKVKNEYIMASCDVSTGESYISILANIDALANEIVSLKAKEVIVSKSFEPAILEQLKKTFQIVVSYEENDKIPEIFSNIVENIEPMYHPTIAILLNYILLTQKRELSHLQVIRLIKSSDYLRLDPFTKRNLELTETLRNGQKNGSLLWHLDHCQTAMGSRMLHKWIDRPLVNLSEIEKRLNFVNVFNLEYLSKEEIKQCLKTVYDLERILGRVSCGNANAKDLVQLRRSLSNVPKVKELISNLPLEDARQLANEIDAHKELYELLEKSLVENPPLTIKEGGMILEGYNVELDEIKNISKNSKDWILNFEAAEKERTGIKTLKVGYNRVFGYYIEVTKGQIAQLGDNHNYERKQTIANAERFITPELKHYEQIVVGAAEKIDKLEYTLFLELRLQVAKYINSLQILANHLACIDVLIAFSEVSTNHHYVRPTFSVKREISIIEGRHPVLETVLETGYVSNDVIINKYNTVIITGPNMSGKSTYMRELALIAIMAQMGCYVPAASACLMIFDQIFTRIGASDDLMSGQSTFMVEMMEANYALTNATKNSLILFDEIGRGTATFDGMALAHAIIEYVHEKIGCVTLFSTHYHELVDLERTLKRLKNVHVAAKETKNGVAFLHKVIDGPTDKSYGINVAMLAGLPKSLIERSKQILNSLEDNGNIKKGIPLDLFNFEEFENRPENIEDTIALELKREIKEIDVNKLTPIEALNILYELKAKIED